MIKRTQVFDWENEPAAERPSKVSPPPRAGTSEWSGLGSFDPTVRAGAVAARKGPLLAPEAARSSPSERDRMLSRLVPRWLEALAPEERPHDLCARYPRIVNRLALCWDDQALAVKLLDDYLRDKRGGRRGFPATALQELRSLRQLALSRGT